MEEYNKSVYFPSSGLLCDGSIEKFSGILVAQEGIDSFRVEPSGIYLEYNPYYQSEKQLKEFLTGKGLKIPAKRHIGFLRKKILNLASSNQKMYGDRKLDCCNTAHA